MIKKATVLLIATVLWTFCVCSDVKVQSQYLSKHGKVFVFDKVIPNIIGHAFMTYYSQYQYVYPDPYEKYYPQSEGDLFWKRQIAPNTLIKMRLWKFIRDAYKSLPEDIHQNKKFLPYESFTFLLDRGDSPKAFKASKEGTTSTGKELYVRVFLSQNYNKNDYCDQAFYNTDDEIVYSVHPRHLRIVFWTGPIETVFRPPSMGRTVPMHGLFLKLTDNMDLFKQSVAEFEANQEEENEKKKLPFPFTNQVDKFDLDSIDPAKHLLYKTYDKHGNAIAFFDNVLPKELVDSIRSYYVRHGGGLSGNIYDQASSETHDNVQYIYQFKPERILNTPYHAVVHKLAAYLSNKTGWHPYDVSCNLIRHTDHTRIHLDCTDDEHEYTFLLYLNPDWTADMYAETAFFDYSTGFDSERGESGLTRKLGNQSYEFITAAVPKFGRIAIFRNLIPHTARPPAPTFLAARYTFPVKVSESLEMAEAKMLREALESKSENVPEDAKYQPLINGEYGDYLKPNLREWVHKHLQLIRSDQELGREEGVKQMKEILFPAKYRGN
ncbi:uncharacterized protein [Clytia hemisphaerica]|uniref:Prolyl 4-hydroxylase alpha subunit Fe(2+) 2OG dioxygenase domain-containing protein n=1 Tax=Clytia hemisphaerica TaxID=252671 RepID=A0A7M5UPH6_9CNID